MKMTFTGNVVRVETDEQTGDSVTLTGWGERSIEIEDRNPNLDYYFQPLGDLLDYTGIYLEINGEEWEFDPQTMKRSFDITPKELFESALARSYESHMEYHEVIGLWSRCHGSPPVVSDMLLAIEYGEMDKYMEINDPSRV